MNQRKARILWRCLMFCSSHALYRDAVDLCLRMGPIEWAARDGNLAAVEALLDAEPDLVHSENCDGWTPLIYASINGNAEVARCLLERGSHVDATEMGGCTALYQTAFDGHVDVAQVLLAKGADPSIRALDGMTALMQAGAGGHEALVHLLLTHGALVDDADGRGRTALHHACERGHSGVVVALLRGGADDRRPVLLEGTQHPATAIDIARQRGHGEVIKVLEEADRAYSLYKARAVFDAYARWERRPHDPLAAPLTGRGTAMGTAEVPRLEVPLADQGTRQEAGVLFGAVQLNSDVFRELMLALGRVRA